MQISFIGTEYLKKFPTKKMIKYTQWLERRLLHFLIYVKKWWRKGLRILLRLIIRKSNTIWCLCLRYKCKWNGHYSLTTLTATAHQKSGHNMAGFSAQVSLSWNQYIGQSSYLDALEKYTSKLNIIVGRI